MNEEKARQFFDLVNGLTYLEWDMLSREVEKFFKSIQLESVLDMNEAGKAFAVKDTIKSEKVFKDIREVMRDSLAPHPND